MLPRLIALILLIILLPLFLVISIFILVLDGFPIFFQQKRPGQHEKIFKIYKFKTMKKYGYKGKTSDEQRLTTLGKFLRNTSLDELPQIINVLKGDMNFIGPRALLVEYLPLYNEKQTRRHLVKPGITGLAQIKGRNNITWAQKFRYDIYYVDHKSFLLNLKILLITLINVATRKNVTQKGYATTKYFNE